jgi:uncharacterized flavoprotein (TIGR03862 family)
MKAAPLLRAWLARLREAGVHFHVRHRWTGWSDGHLRFTTPAGDYLHQADATILALGGGSWARLGSDGAWVPLLGGRGVDVAPLEAANCGFVVASPRLASGAGWSEHFRSRFAGQPLKSVAMALQGDEGPMRPGEAMISDDGIEGSLVYALSAAIRERIKARAAPPCSSIWRRAAAWNGCGRSGPPAGRPLLASHLQSRVGIAGLRWPCCGNACRRPCWPTRPAWPRPSRPCPHPGGAAALDEAISSAGGVRGAGRGPDDPRRAGGLLRGEMLDWEAPTGGYLLTACLASGRRAGEGVLAWLARR